MKKWLILLFLIIILSSLGIYTFIPATLNISEAVMIESSANTASRGLLQEENWSKWLTPLYNAGNEQKEPGENYGFQVANKFNRELEIQILQGQDKFKSRLYVVPQPMDSAIIKWQCQLEASMNPISRIHQYRTALEIKEKMARTLVQLNSFLSKSENIYGLPIKRSLVSDTVLIATRAEFKDQPSTSEIYALIDNLRQYIRQHDARETGYPMMHTDRVDPSHVQIMMAIPVNKRLPDSGKFIFRKMVAGNILVGDVKGGNETIKRAFSQMELYITDNLKQKIAIEFESLVTDRQAEQDSSKWVTKIYFPIVQ